jgi:hypothetical protein
MTTETPALPELATISYTELVILREHVYRGGIRLFQAASATFEKMQQLSTLVPEWAELRAKAALLMSAGREQHQLHVELSDAIKYREQT